MNILQDRRNPRKSNAFAQSARDSVSPSPEIESIVGPGLSYFLTREFDMNEF